MPSDGGHYYDLYLSPLANAETAEEIVAFSWPDPLDPARFIGMRESAHQLVEGEKKLYILERISSGMWEHAIWMVGYEKFFTAMISNQKLVHAVMSKILEIKMQYWEKALEMVGDYPVVISEADDLGRQNGLLVSLRMYKNLIWPYHKRLFEFIMHKAKGKAYIFFHNDGAIYDGFPIPEGIRAIDISLRVNQPITLEVLTEILQHFSVEKAVLAEETQEYSPALFSQLTGLFDKSVVVETMPHAEFKQRSRGVKAVVRSGYFTAYSNFLLVSGAGQRWFVEQA